MSFPFDPSQGLIVIPTRLVGPLDHRYVHLALDTGANLTIVDARILVSIGYDPLKVKQRVQIITASGIEFCPCVTLKKIEALDHARENFPILAHTLPPSASVDGVLGLDFMRRKKLTVDFRAGRVTLQ